MTTYDIDFTNHPSKVLIGITTGEIYREVYKLEELDKKDVVTVHIPDTGSFYTMTFTFFSGMFKDSIRKCASLKAFKEKFKFSIPEWMETDINIFIARCL